MLEHKTHIEALINELAEDISSTSMHGTDVPNIGVIVEELQEAWTVSETYKAIHTFDSSAAFQNFLDRIDDSSSGSGTPPPPFISVFRNAKFAIGSIAASVALVTGLWFLLPEDFSIITNNSDQVKSYALQDGSMLSLFPGSTLSISEDFSDSNRKVVLEDGQVMLDVKSSKLPFVMDLGGNEAVMAGTVFSAEASDENIVISLFEGDIEYRHDGKSTLYTEGSTIIHNLESNQIETLATIDKSIIDFTKGKISFVDTPLNEVFKRLGSFYNVDFQYQPSTVLDRNFTSAVLDHQTLESILKTVEISFDLNIEKKDDDNFVVNLK